MPPLVGEGEGLMCKSVGKTNQLSDYFNSRQYRESVDLPLTFHPSPSLITIAFGSSEVMSLLLDLDPYDPLGMFHFFMKRTTMFRLPVSVQCFRGFFV